MLKNRIRSRIREREFICGTSQVDPGRQLTEDEQIERNINFAKRFFKEKAQENRPRLREKNSRKKLNESIEQEIYSRYQELCDVEGLSDREARWQLTEEFGPSEEDDNYAALIDTIEADYRNLRSW